MKRMTITTSKLAKICGVSQGTVDRALNGRPGIKAETRQKILKAAKQFGYREYIKTRRDKITGQIGVIVFNLNNEYFTRLITELEYALRELGLGTTVMMSHYARQYEIECIAALYNMGADGIILCSDNAGTAFENYLRLFDIPIAAVGNRLQSVPYAGIDDFAAMHDAAADLIAQGWQNIVYFSPALSYPGAYAQKMRYQGFLRAVNEKQTYTVGTDLAGIKERYDQKTVILCSTDYYALQVYCKTQGAKIVGFDNIQAIEKYKLPIDSVGYSMTEIARGAVDIVTGKRKDSVIVPHFMAKHP